MHKTNLKQIWRFAYSSIMDSTGMFAEYWHQFTASIWIRDQKRYNQDEDGKCNREHCDTCNEKWYKKKNDLALRPKEMLNSGNKLFCSSRTNGKKLISKCLTQCWDAATLRIRHRSPINISYNDCRLCRLVRLAHTQLRTN